MDENAIRENNQAVFSGTLASNLQFSHYAFGQSYYEARLEVKRTSGYIDTLPILLVQRVLPEEPLSAGMALKVQGQVRTYNREEGDARRLLVMVYCCDVQVLPEPVENLNLVKLQGNVCRPPVYRLTPLGREITDLFLAVPRSERRTDFIPCVLWGGSARWGRHLRVGEAVVLQGRFQSREYIKRIEGGEEYRVAFEISVSQIARRQEESPSDDQAVVKSATV